MTQRVLDTGTPDLLAEVDDGVAVLSLNRPNRRNALSDEMIEALGVALASCEAAADVRCVIVTGAGGAFCAGGDVKAFEQSGALNQSAEDLPLHLKIENQRRQQRIVAGRLHSMAKPTIACLEGAAAGAGLAIALACDLRVASQHSVLVTAFATVGLSGDYGITWFLTRMLGKARALQLLWLSERLTAERAEHLGLVNRVTPDGGALAAGRELAHLLAAGAPIAQSSMKAGVNRALELDLLTCMDLEVNDSLRCAATEDHMTAVAAFAHREAPVFQGR